MSTKLVNFAIFTTIVLLSVIAVFNHYTIVIE